MKPSASTGWRWMNLLRGVIVLAGAVDTYWAIKVQDHLEELNPIGRLLIAMGGGDVALFMACKLVGTVLAVWLMGLLYFQKPTWALVATSVVACLQVGLCLFLFFGGGG